jgi:succinyl-diaminopimelate desuccinylase
MDPARLCAELVRIRSENPPGNTEEIIHYIRGFLDGIGIRTNVVENRGGRLNLVSASPIHDLLFCGHVDVVPAMTDGWTHGPFSGDIADGYVWGRGATDMKGGCAAVLSALKSIAETGDSPGTDIAFVCDEETSGTYGVCCLLGKRLIKPCDCLIAEPTPALHPNIGQKGLCRLDFHFRGQPGHGSLYPARGVSAVMEAFALLSHLGDLHHHTYETDHDMEAIITESSEVFGEIFGMHDAETVLRRLMFNPGRIEGGEKANIVAQHCNLDLDLRVPWGCAIPALLEDLRAHARNATMEIRSLSEPSLTEAGCRLVTTTCHEITRVFHAPASPVVQWAASDARYLRKEGFRVIEYGPGEMTTLHGVDERVSIESLQKAAEVYAGIITSYGEKSGKKSD